MARNLKTTPILFEPPMPQTVNVGRGNNQPSASWTQTSLAVAQQLDGIGNMLDDVAENNHVEAGLVRNIGNRAVKDSKSLTCGVGYGRRIGIHAGHAPTQRSHTLHEESVPATHIEQASDIGSMKPHHVEGIRSCNRPDPRQKTRQYFVGMIDRVAISRVPQTRQHTSRYFLTQPSETHVRWSAHVRVIIRVKLRDFLDRRLRVQPHNSAIGATAHPPASWRTK